MPYVCVLSDGHCRSHILKGDDEPPEPTTSNPCASAIGRRSGEAQKVVYTLRDYAICRRKKADRAGAVTTAPIYSLRKMDPKNRPGRPGSACAALDGDAGGPKPGETILLPSQFRAWLHPVRLTPRTFLRATSYASASVIEFWQTCPAGAEEQQIGYLRRAGAGPDLVRVANTRLARCRGVGQQGKSRRTSKPSRVDCRGVEADGYHDPAGALSGQDHLLDRHAGNLGVRCGRPGMRRATTSLSSMRSALMPERSRELLAGLPIERVGEGRASDPHIRSRR